MTTTRRPFLQAMASAGALSVFGVPVFATRVGASISGVAIEYNRCRAAFISGASAVNTVAVYYADTDGNRWAVYDIDPLTSVTPRGNPSEGDPLVVSYNADEDRTQIQLREPRGSLVLVIAEAGNARTSLLNSNSTCVPAGFNTSPSAGFTVETDDTPASSQPITVDVNETVTFASTASDPDTPERLSYEWDFGDGTTATGEQTTHSFDTDGDYTVTHTVVDDFGATVTATLIITVLPLNSPPVASFTVETADTAATTGPITVDVGETVIFTSTSTDADLPNDTLTLEWDLDGDGAYETEGITVTKTYDTARVVSVVHQVTDASGVSHTAVTTVTVEETELTFPTTQVAKFTPGDAYDQIGFSTSIDGTTALFGAPYAENGGVGTGVVYVYERINGVWDLQTRLVPDDGEYFDQFGGSVALDGNTALVGAPSASADGVDAGAVYVFVRDGSTWSLQTKLNASDPDFADGFGASVSLDGDTAVAGAPRNEVNSRSLAGAAYVFVRDGSTWSQQQQLLASDYGFNDFFGTSVSVDGDTAVVGAPGEDSNGFDAGASYVFVRNGSTWTQQQKLTLTDARQTDGFGTVVTVDGDTAIFGIPERKDENGNFSAGAAYVFTRSGGVWTERFDLLSLLSSENIEEFGFSVDLDDEIVLVGAPRYSDESAIYVGRVYVFAKIGGEWRYQTHLQAANPTYQDLFGSSVSVSSGIGTVGAIIESNTDAGAGFVFQ